MDALEAALKDDVPVTHEEEEQLGLRQPNSKKTSPVRVETLHRDGETWCFSKVREFDSAAEATKWIKADAPAGEYRVIRVYAELVVAEKQQTIRSVS